MLKILICTALFNAPQDTEVCYVAETRFTLETFCTLASAMATAKPQPRRVTYCRPFDGRLHPDEISIEQLFNTEGKLAAVEADQRESCHE